MKAVAFSRFGGPEVLEVADLPIPEVGPGEVRVRVAAATVNPTDIGMRSGARAAELQKLEPPYVAGMEFSGTIDAVGSGTSWQIGERVLGIVLPTVTGRGAQSEYTLVPADSIVRVPHGVSLEQAATLPMNGLTARRALDLMGLSPGQTLVVTGAAGAVGGYAVQLAVADGLRVIGISSASDEALVRSLGAGDFIARDVDLVGAVRARVPAGVDGVVDAAVLGKSVLGQVRDGGHIAAVRAFDGESERGIHIHQVRVSEYAHNQSALQLLADMVASHQLTLRVAELFPASKASEAQRRLNAGGVRGRLLISFPDAHAALEVRLRELDSSIDELATRGDFDSLGSLLAADFRYNHSTGLSQSRSEWLEGLRPLVGRRDRIPSSIEIELHGDVAVAMGDLDIVWADGRHNYDRYVRVYRSINGEWRAVSQRTVPAHDRAPK